MEGSGGEADGVTGRPLLWFASGFTVVVARYKGCSAVVLMMCEDSVSESKEVRSQIELCPPGRGGNGALNIREGERGKGCRGPYRTSGVPSHGNHVCHI